MRNFGLNAEAGFLPLSLLLVLLLGAYGCDDSGEVAEDPGAGGGGGEMLPEPDPDPEPEPDPVIMGCQDLDGDGFGENCEAGPDCNDARGSAHPGAAEQCGDGIDNDCDVNVEEGCGCNEGEAVPCYPGAEETIGVGRCRSGYRVCRGGVLGACEESRLPIDEICNGTDDDCDGTADEGEGILNECGECGVAPDETCDGADNDCDGQVDELVGNACGGCGLPPAEYCDGLDNDCDGQSDED